MGVEDPTGDTATVLVREPASVSVTGITKTFAVEPVLRDVSMRVAPAAIIALLGPSGCGKTTLLRTIAGLERPDAGEVRIADQVLTGPGVFVPPERRRIGMVFQNWALFPHLTVRQNVAFGLPKADRRGPLVDEALEMVDLGDLGDRSPDTLSGGQQQRVALARALAPRPSVLLLDEPFSNLDTTLRVQIRAEVHGLLHDVGITTIFVTHDQEEAFVLGDKVAVMENGRIAQLARPAELYSRPATRWVADFVGDANLVRARASDRGADTPLGRIELVDGAEGEVDVLIRPEDLRVDRLGPGDATVCTVEFIEFYGHDTVYQLRTADQQVLRARRAGSPRFRRGDDVAVTYTGPETVAYPVAGDGAAPAPA